MLSLGMSYDLFWHGDLCAVNHYLDMSDIRQQNKSDAINNQCYLQGQYIYTALCCVSPLLHAFAKKNTKAHPYPDKPFELKPTESNEMSPELLEERNSLWAYYQMKMLETDVRAQKIIESERGIADHGE